MIAIMSTPDFVKALETACKRSGTRTVQLAAGQTFYRQGEPAPGLPLVVAGEIALMRWTQNGRTVRIHTARAGETFAEASLFEDVCHCDALASRPSTLRYVPRAAALQALSRSPELAGELARHLAHSLVQARRLIELRQMFPLSERVLARLAELTGPDGVLPPELTLSAIAEDLAVTPAAFYRTLAALERRGRIARPARGRVTLLQA